MIATQDRLEERIQIIKRLRDYLQKQREKFRSYLQGLDNQETAIRVDDTESLQIHVELEQSIVGEIYTLQNLWASYIRDIEESLPQELKE